MKKNEFLSLCTLLLFCLTSVAQISNEVLGTSVVETEGTFTTGSSLTTGDFNVLIGDGAGSMLTFGSNNTFLGTSAGAQTTVSENVFIGRFAGYFNISGTDNVFIGTEAGRLNTAFDNVFIGTEAGENNTSGTDNVFIGEESGTNNTEGSDNVFIGEDAGFNNTIADDNTFVGSTAGRQNTTGEGNTFVGGESNFSLANIIDSSFGGNGIYTLASRFGGVGYDNTTGNGNSFFGSGAGVDNGVGMANTFLGYGAGSSNEHGDLNTFVGYGAGWDNNRTNSTTNANRNTYLGVIAGGTNREGSDNIGIGHDANFSVNTGAERNIFIGGSSRVRGTDNIVIGYNAKTRTNANRNNQIVIGVNSSTTENNAIVIGNNVTSTSANTLTLGGNTVTNRVSVGIGTLAANQNASLELADVDKGFLLNRVTTAERTAMETTPASGAALTTTDIGLMVYDTDLKSLFSWDGTMWSAAETNTDNQELNLTTDVLSISGGTETINLSGYLDNTDTQELSLNGTTLAITGNATTVDLSVLQDGTGTDSQNLVSAVVVGNNLTIAIENGDPVTVDLSPILSNLESQNANQQSQIDDLLSRVASIESCACGGTLSIPGSTATNRNNSILYQNIPNPFNGTTSIKYYIPYNKNNGAIVFSNNSGQIIDNIKLENFGEQELFFNSESLASGIYYYTLFVDGRKVDSKKMIID